MSGAIPCAHCGNTHPAGAAFCPFTGLTIGGAPDPRIGTQIGEYVIERVIGAGAHGTVYRARDERGDAYALKILRTDAVSDADRAARRFAREIRATQGIRHPNVVSVIDAGALEDHTPWLAMELVEGESLRARLDREGRVSIADAARIGVAVLDALDTAHGAGVIHRDVKPENVLLAQIDGRLVPKLADFGLAFDHGPQITAPGSVVGTPRYVSPEQARGKRDVDARIDLWGVGVMLYESLTGRVPFAGHDVIATLLAILSATPEPLRAIRPEVSAGIEACVLRAIEKDPARRFASAREMKMVLRAAVAAETSSTEEMDSGDVLGATVESGEGAAAHDPLDGDTLSDPLERATTRKVR